MFQYPLAHPPCVEGDLSPSFGAAIAERGEFLDITSITEFKETYFPMGCRRRRLEEIRKDPKAYGEFLGKVTIMKIIPILKGFGGRP